MKTEEGYHGQGRQPLEGGKGKGVGSPLEPPEGRQPCQHGDFSPVKPVLDF